MSLLIIGEASTKLMDSAEDWVQSHPQVAWRSMRGMRNRIAHGYYEVDLNVVWETVQTALPPLRSELDRLLAEWVSKSS